MGTEPEKLWDAAKQYLLAILDTQNQMREYLKQNAELCNVYKRTGTIRFLEEQYNRILIICYRKQGFEVADDLHDVNVYRKDNLIRYHLPREPRWLILGIDDEQAIAIKPFSVEYPESDKKVTFQHRYDLSWMIPTCISLPIAYDCYIEWDIACATIDLSISLHTSTLILYPRTVMQNKVRDGLKIPQQPYKQIIPLERAAMPTTDCTKLQNLLCTLDIRAVIDDRDYYIRFRERPIYPPWLFPDLMVFTDWDVCRSYAQAVLDFLVEDFWKESRITASLPREGSNGS